MSGSARPPETVVVEAAARYLRSEGYSTRIDPDGRSYFDLVARRGDEVGLVEAKVADARAVMHQALLRRPWADWVAVVLPSERSATRLHERTRGRRAEPVGIWCLRGGEAHVIRPAQPWPKGSTADPYAPFRERFRGVLDALDRGEIPDGVEWTAVPSTVRRASGGRGFREWRLDEGPDDAATDP
jgi:hypothetical protein